MVVKVDENGICKSESSSWIHLPWKNSMNPKAVSSKDNIAALFYTFVSLEIILQYQKWKQANNKFILYLPLHHEDSWVETCAHRLSHRQQNLIYLKIPKLFLNVRKAQQNYRNVSGINCAIRIICFS